MATDSRAPVHWGWVGWWSDAFLNNSGDSTRQFLLEARQTLSMLVVCPTPEDVVDAVKMHRIRLAKDQGLRSWEPKRFMCHVEQAVVVAFT